MTTAPSQVKSTSSPFWESVKAQYPNHWVLIGNPEFKPNGCIIQGGDVLFATDRKDNLIPERRKHRIPCAIEFTGERPKRLLLYTL